MTIQQLTETADFIKNRCKLKPRIGIILGSGLGHFVQHMNITCTLPFGEIPHFIPPTVEGHSGNLILGTIENVPLVVLQGRLHFYEGHSMNTVVYPTRTMAGSVRPPSSRT